LLTASLLLAAAAAPAVAQFVKRDGKKPPAKTLTLAEELSASVGEGLGKPSKAGELEAGIPKPLHAVFSNTYESTLETRDRVVAKYRGYQQAFDTRWTEVEARRKEVAAAVDKAKGLAKSKKFGEARAALEAVLTGTSVEEDGQVPARTDILLPMDAELPALYELAGIARDSGDPFVLPDIAAALRARRRILADKPSEAYVWMAYSARQALARQEGNALGSFSAGMPAVIGRALERIENTMAFLFGKDGILMAQGFFHHLPSYGVALGDMLKQASVKIGGYALFEIMAEPGVKITVKADKVTYTAKIQQQFPVNCRESDKIDGYDPVSKKFSYRSECEYQDRFFDVVFEAGLRAAPPAWATNGEHLWVLGKVKKASVKDDGKTLKARWSLEGAEVVDFRFLGAMTIVDFGDAAATIF
jgi:hypothetical protein